MHASTKNLYYSLVAKQKMTSVLKTIAALSILTLNVLITRAPVKECNAFRIKWCAITLLSQSILKIVYISICVEIIKWLLPV